jgi:hypothetical protein
MKRLRLLQLIAAFVLIAGLFAPSHAAPASAIAPAVESNTAEVQAVCHHYRWSSRRHCTSANSLRFVARPPLYYPHRYFGGAPHYAYQAPYGYFGYRGPYYGPYGFYRSPWPRRYFWY